ncbi:DUF7594 domain-containing protein [Sediminibacillus halophilus]|uniref:Right handed beta helix region n=1 Tax=Sediminibacillus halophilus TaxID=482461 RepID=A0A1G9RW83_9BACI|nr:DNRLRE domain-containing protein [Sediminibacillus halophilus]SDM26745.1 Right handed beta helix region [Sediminibacillus halophilus]
MKKSIALFSLICLSLWFCLSARHGSLQAEESIFHYPVIDVTASVHDGNVPENTLDDNLSTRWSAQGIGQWIQYDLGSRQQLGYLGLGFYNGDIRSTTVDIELSIDGEEWNKVVEQQESSGTSINLEAFDFADQEARFVRIIGYGNSRNDWNSITAAHIYPPNPDGPIVEELEAIDPGPVPDADPFTKAGLYYPDKTPYTPPSPHPVTGKTIHVTDFGADLRDNSNDDTLAINAAIQAAEPGDEVYFPNGTYNLKGTMENDFTSHIYLKDEVNLRGETKTGVLLISDFDMREVPNSKVMTAYGKKDLTISNLTITSTFDGNYSENPSENNPDRGGPAYGIFIADSAGQPSHHITVSNITIEKFQRMGVRIEKSNRNTVEHATFKNATDVGGGGAGYGVGIQGIQGIDRLGHANDTYFNVVKNSHFEGPYLRHGTLIQNYAHNNLVEHNTYQGVIHDAVDLHGQREYLNEIRHNHLDDIPRGGIGVGNTGGTPPNSHSASGSGNYIHHNTLKDTRDGIIVMMGSPGTVIENNKIMHTSTPPNAKGIYLLNAPGTLVKNNKIVNNNAEGFWGIFIAEDDGDTRNGGKGAGIPKNILVEKNKLIGNTNGIRVEAGKEITIKDNIIRRTAGEDYINLIGDESISQALVPSDDALIDFEKPDVNYGVMDQDLIDTGDPDRNFYKYFNIKQNSAGSKGRMALYQFDLHDLEEIESAELQLTGKTGSNTSSVTLAVYGILNNEWQEDTITWRSAPNVGSEKVEITGIGDSAFYLGAITVDQSEPTLHELDVTAFVEEYGTEAISFLVADIQGQNGNVNIYSKEETNETRSPALYITTKP